MSLAPVDNDTGRVAYCGPYVLAGITGQPITTVERVIAKARGSLEAGPPVIKGTSADEVTAALAAFGYRMELKTSFMSRARQERPTLSAWIERPRDAWAHYILAIHSGKDGHWVLIKGAKLCDTFTGGRWMFVCDGPHRGKRVMEVFEVKRDPLFGL